MSKPLYGEVCVEVALFTVVVLDAEVFHIRYILRDFLFDVGALSKVLFEYKRQFRLKTALLTMVDFNVTTFTIKR